MEDLILLVCRIFHIAAAAYGICFAAISLWMFRKAKPLPNPQRPLHFAVLIPARNEERCIAGIIESLRQQDYPPELVDIYVIPNNCTDSTEAAARAAGACILSVSPGVCCKGQVLNEAFSQLLRTGSHEAYCVFDADNEVSTGFLREMNRALSTARAAKSRIYAKNPHESWVCAAYDTFFCNANLLLNRPRQRIGLSAHLIGTGFAVRRDLMEELGGWNTDTLTEDAEFYVQLCTQGEPIAFVPDAVTYDEEPLTFRESLTQRRRWMGGLLAVNKTAIPELLCSIFSGSGGWRAADCLLQLSFVSLQAWIIPVFLMELCIHPADTLASLPFSILSFCSGAIALGAFSLLMEHRMTWYKAACLPLYPLFLFSFLLLQTLSLFLPVRYWKPIRHTGVRL